MGFLNGLKAFLEGLLLKPMDNRPIGLGPIHDMSDEFLLNQLSNPATPRPQFNAPMQQPSFSSSPYQFSTLPTPIPQHLQRQPISKPTRSAKPMKKNLTASPAFAPIQGNDYTFRPVPPRYNPWTQKSL